MPAKIVALAIPALAIATLSLGSFYKVNEGERAVHTRNGVVVGVSEPGLHFKLPLIDGAVDFSVRDQVAHYPGMQAYTRDQQTATVTNISINYRINPADVETIYRRYGSVDNMVNQLVTRRVGETLEQVFGQYNAERAVQDRAKLGIDFSTAIKQVNGPMEITSVQVENFSFPDEYERNINDRMAAEVDATKAEQTARKTVTEAKAAADAQIATATADAEAVRMAGEAEAAAIRAKGEALRENPALIELIAAQQWDGVLPTTMVPGGATPFVNVGR